MIGKEEDEEEEEEQAYGQRGRNKEASRLTRKSLKRFRTEPPLHLHPPKCLHRN